MEGSGCVDGREGARAGSGGFWWWTGCRVNLGNGPPPRSPSEWEKRACSLINKFPCERGERNATGRTSLGCTGLHDREVPILLWAWGTSSYP